MNDRSIKKSNCQPSENNKRKLLRRIEIGELSPMTAHHPTVHQKRFRMMGTQPYRPSENFLLGSYTTFQRAKVFDDLIVLGQHLSNFNLTELSN